MFFYYKAKSNENIVKIQFNPLIFVKIQLILLRLIFLVVILKNLFFPMILSNHFLCLTYLFVYSNQKQHCVIL